MSPEFVVQCMYAADPFGVIGGEVALAGNNKLVAQVLPQTAGISMESVLSPFQNIPLDSPLETILAKKSISLSSQVLYGSSRLGTMNYLSGQYGMSYHRVSHSQSVYTSTKLSTSDYYPFGSLMPGRTVMDTTVHCVDMTQIDRVWQPAYEDGLPFNSLFSEMSPWGAASYLLSPDQLDLFIEDEQSGIKLLLDSGIGSGSLVLEGKVLNITDRGIVLRVQGVDAEGNGVVYHQEHLGQFDGKMEIPLDSAYSDYVVNIQGLLQWSILGNTVVNGHWVETEVLVRVCDEVGDKYRFGFNGGEKINEISGIGNYVDIGERGADTRIGRLNWRIDPDFHKYPSLSPYAYAANSPIRFIDVDGKGPGDVVVVFAGADLFATGGIGSAQGIVDNIRKKDFSQNGGYANAFASKYWGVSMKSTKDLDVATQSAYNAIKANYNVHNGEKVEGGKAIIYGYSWGGVLAQHLTDRLKKDGMNVDLLITLDAAAGNKSNQVDRSVPENVKENLNIYQTTPSLIKSHGGKNSADNPKKTKVINSNYTNRYIGEPGKSDYQEVDHSSIDEITQPVVNDKILNTVQDGRK